MRSIFNIFFITVTSFLVSCALPYDYGFVTDIFTGQCPYKFVFDGGNTKCSCPGYEYNQTSGICEASPAVKACKAETGSSYNSSISADDYCPCTEPYSLDAFGFCSTPISVGIGEELWTSDGSDYAVWNGYTLLNQNIFYIDPNVYICRTFLKKDGLEAITNCRGKDAGENLALNYYSEVKSTNGFKIKDVLFLLYDDLGLKAKEFVLSVDSDKVYKDFFAHSSLGAVATPEYSTNELSNEIKSDSLCGADCSFKLIAPDPAHVTVNNLNPGEVKFIASDGEGISKGTKLYFEDGSDLINASFSQLKFGVDSNNHYFYTYFDSNNFSSFGYDGELLHSTPTDATASDIFYKDLDYYFVYQTSSHVINKSGVTNWVPDSLIENFLDPLSDFVFDAPGPKIFAAKTNNGAFVYLDVAEISSAIPKLSLLSKLTLKVDSNIAFSLTYLNDGGNSIRSYKFTSSL